MFEVQVDGRVKGRYPCLGAAKEVLRQMCSCSIRLYLTGGRPATWVGTGEEGRGKRKGRRRNTRRESASQTGLGRRSTSKRPHGQGWHRCSRWRLCALGRWSGQHPESPRLHWARTRHCRIPQYCSRTSSHTACHPSA